MRAKSTPTLSGWPNQSCQLLLHHSPLYISSLFSFLLSEFFSAYSGLSSPSLLPWRWIYKTSGQRPSLCTGLDQIYFLFSALCFERRVRARERISRKTLVVQGYLGWRGWGIPYRTCHFFFYFWINLFSPLESKQSTRKVTIYPQDHVTAVKQQMEMGKEQLRTNCLNSCLSKWWSRLTCLFPSTLLSSHLSAHAYLVEPSPSVLDCSSSISHFKNIIPPVIRPKWRTRVVLGPLSNLCPQPSCPKTQSAWLCPNTRETLCRSWRSCGRNFLSNNPRLATAASRSAVRRYLR